MKNTKVCPKCKSNKIIRAQHHWNQDNTLPVGIFSWVRVARYICGQCGFIENWIDSENDLNAVREKYGSE
jgi:ribosomal protein S27AE